MVKLASHKFSLVLVLAALLLLWLYSLLNMHWWQQTLHNKLEQLVPDIHTESQNIEQDSTLLISDIALPQAPVIAGAAPPEVNTKITAQENAKPKENKERVTPVEIENVKVQPQPIHVPIQEPEQEPQQQQSAEQVYQQLQADNSLDLQIALPASSAKQQQLFDYLYRCAGVQFAVLQQQQLSYLSPQRYVPISQWLRVANGHLSKQEQQWLGQQSGTPIRVFPQAIDQRLAQYLATSLQGITLSRLRATYELTPAGLALSNIQLNTHSIKGNWLLHNSQCAA